MSEKVELVGPEQKTPYSTYQKAEYFNSPEDGTWSLFGGSGINFKLTDNFSVDGLFAGKTASDDKNGYQTDLTANYNWTKLDTELAGITFASQARLRYQHCGSKNLQLRLVPAKVSLKSNTECIPINELYTYPAYATLIHDLKSDDDKAKFGALIGVSKNINKNSSIYFEVQTDTKDERFTGSTWGCTIGYKHTF